MAGVLRGSLLPRILSTVLTAHSVPLMFLLLNGVHGDVSWMYEWVRIEGKEVSVAVHEWRFCAHRDTPSFFEAESSQ